MKIAFRLKLATGHLLFSAALILASVGFLYWGWYYSPNWQLMGAMEIVATLTMVDLGIGPLATLVIASHRKPWRTLRRDLIIIGIFQLTALSLALHALWIARPLYFAFNDDRFEVVTAADLDLEGPKLQSKVAQALQPEQTRFPTMVWAKMPSLGSDATSIATRSFFTGRSIYQMPQTYRPLIEATAQLRTALMPISRLDRSSSQATKVFQALLDREKKAEAELGFIPLIARAGEGSIVFDRKTLEPVAIFALGRRKNR